jgi:hypothetical protein
MEQNSNYSCAHTFGSTAPAAAPFSARQVRKCGSCVGTHVPGVSLTPVRVLNAKGIDFVECVRLLLATHGPLADNAMDVATARGSKQPNWLIGPAY